MSHIVEYVDLDYVGNLDNQISTMGYVFTMDSAPIYVTKTAIIVIIEEEYSVATLINDQ